MLIPKGETMKTIVKKISHKGASSTIEWTDSQGHLNRAIVPSDELVAEADGTFTIEDAEEGYPYGVEWESLIHTKMGPKAIGDLLRKNGIWTLEDYLNNSRTITSVFNEACSANLQQFKEAVLNFRDNKEEME